jgi:hypothetical protein
LAFSDSYDLLMRVKALMKTLSPIPFVAILLLCYLQHIAAQADTSQKGRWASSPLVDTPFPYQQDPPVLLADAEVFGSLSPEQPDRHRLIPNKEFLGTVATQPQGTPRFGSEATLVNPSLPDLQLWELIQLRHIVLPSEYTPPPGTLQRVGMIDATSIVVYVEGEFMNLPLKSKKVRTEPDDFNPRAPPQPVHSSITIDNVAIRQMLEEMHELADFDPPLNSYLTLKLQDGSSFTGKLTFVTSDKAYFERPGFRSSRIIEREDIAAISRAFLFRKDHVEALVASRVDKIERLLTLIEGLEVAHYRRQFYYRAPKTVKYFSHGDYPGERLVSLQVPNFLSELAVFVNQPRSVMSSLQRGSPVAGAVRHTSIPSYKEFVFPSYHNGETILLRLSLNDFVSSPAEWRAIVEHESNLIAAEAQRRAAAAQAAAVRREAQLREETALRERRLAEERNRQEEQHRQAMLREAQSARWAAEAAARKEDEDRKELIRLKSREADASEQAARELERIRWNQEIERRNRW